MTVLLFARPREVVGTGRLDIELGEGATAGDAFDLLAGRLPELARMKRALRPAVDNAYATWASELSDGGELALIPPTAGG
ncbi:MAG TPA: MoaD/ThiS family protein [Candidatus Dormibacteraeota bacterium]|nr:MoaD/ThiS family protein [Candidatus Dormibacteraeota bacterium]